MQDFELSDAIDSAVDIPFFYIGGEADARLTAVEALEVHRCAGQAHALMVARPRASSGHGHEDVFGEESDLLEQLRGAHFFTLFPNLPVSYRHGGGAFLSKEPQPEEGALRPIAWAPERMEVLDATLAARASLRAVFSKLDGVDPAYARARKSPCAGVDQFVDLLRWRVAPAGPIPRFGHMEPKSGVNLIRPLETRRKTDKVQ
jgi:hypothetical protein